MTTFYMLVGLPGSGKSSLANKILVEAEKNGRDVVWVSSDNIRKDFYGSEEIQGDSKIVFEEMYAPLPASPGPQFRPSTPKGA